MPAFLNIVDIAGLVKGAAEGQGLGNAFLSHIGACDAIFHLCRAFDDPDVIHVEGEVNPVRDFDIIAEELRLKDEETLLKNLEKLERTCIRGTDKKLKPEYVSSDFSDNSNWFSYCGATLWRRVFACKTDHFA